MSIPHTFKPLGVSSGGALPPGYERVDSVFKDASTYWQTDLPIGSGYRVDTCFMITKRDMYSEFSLFANNQPPSNNRIYYIFAGGQNFRMQPSRFVAIDPTQTFSLNLNEKIRVICEQRDYGVTLIWGDLYFNADGLTPISKTGDFQLGASITSYGTLNATSECRIYSFRVYKAGTNILLANYVPYRRVTDEGMEYGLFDTVKKNVLPAIGEPKP